MFDAGTCEIESLEDEYRAMQNSGPGRAKKAIEREIVDSLPFYRRLALRRLRSPSDAEDVTQAFALKSLERADQLRDPLAVRGWLRRVFETTLVDHCRGTGRRREREISFDLHLHDKIENDEGHDQPPFDPGQVVAKLLPRLKPEYADIVRKMDLLDRPRSEVAGELGITVNNLTVRLHRARSALRDQICQSDSHVAAIAA